MDPEKKAANRNGEETDFGRGDLSWSQDCLQ